VIYYYYYNPVYHGSSNKIPLLVVSDNNKENMFNYVTTLLQEIRGRDRNGGES
jgi:hypothetical protein